jgi:hypothetical protein
LTTDQPALHHDERIDKEKIYHPRSVYEFGILAPGKSEVFVITSTLKKQRLDPIDIKIGSHQDKGNSVFIDLIDLVSDYLPDQL